MCDGEQVDEFERQLAEERERAEEAIAKAQQMVDNYVGERDLWQEKARLAEGKAERYKERLAEAEVERDQALRLLYEHMGGPNPSTLVPAVKLVLHNANETMKLCVQYVAERNAAEAERDRLHFDLNRHLSSVGIYPKEHDDLVALACRAFAVEHERAKRAEAELAAIEQSLADGGITTVGTSFESVADAVAQTIEALRKAEVKRDWLREALEEITEGTPFSTRSKDGDFLRELARAALAAIEQANN